MADDEVFGDMPDNGEVFGDSSDVPCAWCGKNICVIDDFIDDTLRPGSSLECECGKITVVTSIDYDVTICVDANLRQRLTCPLRLPCKAWIVSVTPNYYGLLVEVVDIGDGRIMAGFENSNLCRTYLYCRPDEILVSSYRTPSWA